MGGRRALKYHLNDDAQLSLGVVYAPIMVDLDSIYRPWRFAHRNPLPRFVLFPRIERTAKRIKTTHQEIAYRTRTAVAALRGDIDDDWCR